MERFTDHSRAALCDSQHMAVAHLQRLRSVLILYDTAFSGFSCRSVLCSENKIIPHTFLFHVTQSVLISEECFVGEDTL